MYFSKALVVLSIALSAMASPHMLRRVNHHDIARRAPVPAAEPEPVLAAPRRKRTDNKRCKVRSTSSVPSSTAAPTTSIVVPQNVESDPASSPKPATSATPTTSPAEAKPTTQPATTHQQQTTASPTTHHTTAAAPTTSSSSGGSSSTSGEPGFMSGTHIGDGTFYSTGLGSCGVTNTDTDFIVAVSHLLYDAYPGYNGVNPNDNPVCGRKIRATYQGKSVDVVVEDRCVGCAEDDLDFSPTAFSQLADLSVGRLHGMTWVWL
ncbi:RlpA-like double-psi beta-barrel-protein domain-containing protein-containing protein [Trametes punicea]|nr:RlpA-like double-psi beta-barrel-protein domain-containing protein-containing protein [Trametes punicea]